MRNCISRRSSGAGAASGSFSVFTTAAGVPSLTVEGNANFNWGGGNNTFLGSGDLTVYGNLNVSMGGGNDSVNYVLTGQLLAGVARTVVVNLGAGQNNFTARLQASLQTRSSLSIEVGSGSGGDNLNLLAGGNVSIAARASLNMAFFGGTDANTINATYLGQLAGTLTVFERGGAERVGRKFQRLALLLAGPRLGLLEVLLQPVVVLADFPQLG